VSYQYGAKTPARVKVEALKREEATLLEALREVRRKIQNERFPAAKSPAPAKQCGSNAAYQRHLRRKEEPCDPCKDARKAYMGEYRGGGFGRRVQPCGTYAAHRRHLRKGEEPCEPCKVAFRIYHQEKRAQMSTVAPVMPPSRTDLAA
jgi:hypothetical protein